MVNQNNVKILTEKEVQIMQAINDGGKGTFAEVTAMVEQSMLKTNNPLAKEVVTKLTTYNVLLNANYTNLVNNTRVREGKEANFKAKKNWHEKVYDSENGSIVCNPNKRENRYLMASVNFAKTLTYYVNGVEATNEQVEIIKQFKSKSSAKNQGLDKEVVIRTIGIEGIKEVRANKQVLTY
jgi:hypothetical protein